MPGPVTGRALVMCSPLFEKTLKTRSKGKERCIKACRMS